MQAGLSETLSYLQEKFMNNVGWHQNGRQVFIKTYEVRSLMVVVLSVYCKK